MGSISAKKLRDVVKNVRACLAIEVMTAAAGIDQRAPLRPAKGVDAALSKVREKVAPMTGDRPLYPDIEAVQQMLANSELTIAATKVVGPLA